LHSHRVLKSRLSAAGILALATFILGSAALPSPQAFAQATNTSGAIQGTITDASGAVLPGASVTITNTGTSQNLKLTTDSAGFYSSGPLPPGSYTVTVTGSGFSQIKSTVVVQISSITTDNLKLKVGSAAQVVEVDANGVQVNTEQTNVQSVLNRQQIENLPVQGRNFLDLAQLEPGVQLQSGETFDPTKAGYSALSIGGVSGRTTRILLDGSDITDETVGTTIFNVPSGAIGEFQLNRSTGDVSGDITSSGSVFVATPSGTNSFHGQGFYFFQDHNVGFSDSGGGINPPFQRNQFGGYAGGPIVKDKLFIFGDLERIKQDSGQTVTLSPAFASTQAANPFYGSPFRDIYSVLRLDYNAPKGVHLFARANYEVNSVASTFGLGYSRYANRDNTPGIAFGGDFVTGKFTHSFRGSYEKFHNLISDASGSGIYNPVPSIELHVPGSGFYSGPNLLAPQQTYQSDKQLRYDGSWTKGAHTLRYGASLNRILGGGFASFFGLAPEVVTLPSSATPSDPSSYLPSTVTLGNGQGFNTELPSFGAPAGGQGDYRTAAYIADTWKVTPSFTLNVGVRWSRDTGRSDADVAPLPCSTIDTAAFPNPPCTGNQLILDQFGPGLGDRIRQPNFNFGPQLGIAYAPGSLNGKTVLRAGIGFYYENFVFNNILFDRPAKLPVGLFLSEAQINCSAVSNITVNGVTVPGGDAASIGTLCSEPAGVSGPGFAQISKNYQSAVAAAGASANSSYVGETLAIAQASGLDAYAPHQFTTPRSIHVNFGIEQQLGKGIVVSADYVHQVDYKFTQSQDINAVGDARYYDPVAAAAAVTNTIAACGAATFEAAAASCPGLHSDGSGATIADYSGIGLGSGVDVNGGFPTSGVAAFPGKNPNVGQGLFQFPNGRSGYDALQLSFKSQVSNPLPGLVAGNFEASYSYSRFVTTAAGTAGSDQYFQATSWNWRNPTQNIGRGSLDRPQQLSFGGYTTIKRGPQIGLTAHFASAIPTSLILDNLSGTGGQLFQTDFFGQGNTEAGLTTGQLAPGTSPGDYGRAIKPGNLNGYINNFNSRFAGTLTPAGQQVVNSGVLTQAQLASIGGTIQPLAPAPANPLENGDLKEIDANFSYPIKLARLREGLSLIPSVAFYNIANFANYGGALNEILLNSADAGSSGYTNGPSTFADRGQFRTERGSGTFNLGGPRTTEFQLKLNF
jgi:Carboxypeptidase regulatory-like domain/TonB-dependent Receptor Plug Domain